MYMHPRPRPGPRPTLEDFPFRSPLSLATEIKHIIRGRSVCDLGCGAGDVLLEMAALGGRSIVGIERDENRYQLAARNGRTFVRKGSFLELPIPDCDVYFIWISSLLYGVYELIERLPRGKTVVLASAEGTASFDRTSFGKTRVAGITQYIEYIGHNYDESGTDETILKRAGGGWEHLARGRMHLHVLKT